MAKNNEDVANQVSVKDYGHLCRLCDPVVTGSFLDSDGDDVVDWHHQSDCLRIESNYLDAIKEIRDILRRLEIKLGDGDE